LPVTFFSINATLRVLRKRREEAKKRRREAKGKDEGRREEVERGRNAKGTG
jgi:hypothetical protein